MRFDDQANACLTSDRDVLAVATIDAIGPDPHRRRTAELPLEVDQAAVDGRGGGHRLERRAWNVRCLDGAVEQRL